ncbi:MAG: threonine/serine dehydratase [Actinobacteria bacterium]|nr:threonine/serine dehydratase [Actinomycetota bacterium]
MADELTLNRVLAAASRLSGVAHRTPALSSATLDRQYGAPVLLKAEPLQRTGSFKFRGAYNRLSVLDETQRTAGVVAFSSGNHGAAVALAARLLGIRAVVVVPADGSRVKLAAIENYGAELRRYDPLTESREKVADAIAAEQGLTLVRPFDDYDVMAGQGTIGVELSEQVPDVELVLVPVGGGGLAAGVSTAVTGLLPGAAVIGVEPAAAGDTAQSMRAGHRVNIPEPDTLADGLRATAPGELTFAVNSRLLKDVVTVSEEAVIEAMRFCFERLKIVVEPSGAVPLAALLSGAAGTAGRTAVVLSGGNIAAADFAAIVTR